MGDNKFERIDSLKDRIIMLVEGQLSGDLSCLDAQELGEVMDMAKDCAELKKYCAEAEYYDKITKAMGKNTDPENAYYMDKYMPETMRYYTRPIRYNTTGGNSGGNMGGNSGGMGTNGGRYYWEYDPRYPEHDYEKDPRYSEMYPRMYYTPMTDLNWPSTDKNRPHDPREGRAYVSRRGYMEAKEHGDKNEKNKELEQYMNDISMDITEMINGMDANEKQSLKAKLTQIAAKIA